MHPRTTWELKAFPYLVSPQNLASCKRFPLRPQYSSLEVLCVTPWVEAMVRQVCSGRVNKTPLWVQSSQRLPEWFTCHPQRMETPHSCLGPISESSVILFFFFFHSDSWLVKSQVKWALTKEADVIRFAFLKEKPSEGRKEGWLMCTTLTSSLSAGPPQTVHGPSPGLG